MRVPLVNVVGGLNKGWATAMSTLGFERGTASLALLIETVSKVETLLAACPASRPVMRARLAALRAEGASVMATSYRFALDSERTAPDASGSMIRLSFAEFAQRVTAAAIDLYGIDAPEVVGLHGWGHEYHVSPSLKRSRAVPPRSSATSSPSACSVCPKSRARSESSE